MMGTTGTLKKWEQREQHHEHQEHQDHPVEYQVWHRDSLIPILDKDRDCVKEIKCSAESTKNAGDPKSTNKFDEAVQNDETEDRDKNVLKDDN